jgi:hypothetical protein
MLDFFVVGGYCIIKHYFLPNWPTNPNFLEISWNTYWTSPKWQTSNTKWLRGGTIGTMSIHTCHKWGAVGATNRVSHMIVYPHLYLHCMFNISPLHPHCIPIIISPFYLHYVPHYCISPLHLHYILVISALYLPLYQPVNSPWSPL